jgi:hypothetical protein
VVDHQLGVQTVMGEQDMARRRRLALVADALARLGQPHHAVVQQGHRQRAGGDGIEFGVAV